MRKTILAAGAALILVSCGGEDATGDGVGTDMSRSSAGSEAIAAAASTTPKPVAGQWETTAEVLEVRIPGMPPGMEDMAKGMFADMFGSQRYCLTQEQADEDPAALWRETQGDCEWEKFDMSDGHSNAQAVCRNDDGSEARMKMTGTYTPTSYSADNEMTLNSPQGDGYVKVHVEGRRIGDC